jgi:hypothetical protein
MHAAISDWRIEQAGRKRGKMLASKQAIQSEKTDENPPGASCSLAALLALQCPATPM